MNRMDSPNIVILDETDVDVFIGERDDIDFDEGRAEGALLSLLSAPPSAKGLVAFDDDDADAIQTTVKSRTTHRVEDSVEGVNALARSKSILKMLLTLDVGHVGRAGRTRRSIPILDAIREVAWSDVKDATEQVRMVRTSDVAYIDRISAIREKKNTTHTAVVDALALALRPFAPTDQNKTKKKETVKREVKWTLGPRDAYLLNYRPRVRLVPTDAVRIVGASVSVSISNQRTGRDGRKVWDVDAYVASLNALKAKDLVDIYDAGASTPRIKGRVTLATPDQLVISMDVDDPKQSKIQKNQKNQDTEKTVTIDKRITATSVFVNTPSPALPVDVMSYANANANASWETLAAWVTPKFLLSKSGKRPKSMQSMQSVLDRLGWPEDRNMSVAEWEDLTSRRWRASLKPVPTLDKADLAKSEKANRWIDEGAYKRHYIANVANTNATMLYDAWCTADQPDTGFLALLSAAAAVSSIVVAKPKDKGRQVGGSSGTIVSKNMTPYAVLGQFGSDGSSAEVARVRECDLVSFTDFAGLRDVVAQLRTSRESKLEALLGSPVMEYAGLRVPKSVDRAMFTNAATAIDPESPRNIEAHASIVSVYLRHFSRHGKHGGRGATFAPIYFQPAKVKVGQAKGDGQLQFAQEDAGFYSVYYRAPNPSSSTVITSNKNKVVASTDNWDYGRLLRLLCLTASITLPPAAFDFLVNNAVFANPVELYMKKLRNAISSLKARRHEHMMAWKGGMKSYQVQEDRLVAKMRRDTLGVFCGRTMACFAALLTLSTATSTVSTSTLVEKIMEIMRDGLGLPCEVVALERMISIFKADFAKQNKVVPSSSASFSKKEIKKTAWVGFRPEFSRTRPVMEEIEAVVRQNPVATKGHNRCCQATTDKLPNYFASTSGVSLAMSSGQGTLEGTVRERSATDLWEMPGGFRVAADATRQGHQQHQQKQQKRRGEAVKIERSVRDQAASPSDFLKINAHIAVPSNREMTDALNKACEAVGRPHLPELLPTAHASPSEVDVRHRVAMGFVKVGMPAIYARERTALRPVKRIDLLTNDVAGHGGEQVSILVAVMLEYLSQIINRGEPGSKLTRALLDDLRTRLDCNVIDEAALMRSLQREHEEQKLKKMELSSKLTDEERDVLHELRKFGRVSAEDLGKIGAHLGLKSQKETTTTTKDKLNLEPDEEGKHATVMQGLGAFDRDEDVSNDDVGYE